MLKLDPANLKARQRRAKGAWETQRLAVAEEDVAFVLAADPTHAGSLKLQKLIDAKNKGYKAKQAAAFKGMFG